MHPIAFYIGEYPVRYAGLLYVVAVIVVWAYARRVARRRSWNIEAVLPGMALVVTAAYLGARLHGAIRNWDLFAANPIRELLRAGDLSFFGGLALGSLVLVLYLRSARLPIGAVADELAVMAPVVYAIFRLGCFLNGDDYGRTTAMPWGMVFPEGSPRTSEPVHPLQLYEIAAMIPLTLILLRRRQRNLPAGALAYELCALMGFERFIADFLRESSGNGLAYTQWMALAFCAVGLVGRIRVTGRARSRIT